jgi:hypothetical protein
MMSLRPSLTIPSLATLLLSGLALSPAARAEGEGGGHFRPDRVAEVLMDQARQAGVTACEGILTPAGNGTFRLTYRVVRPGTPMIARPDDGMTAVIMTDACLR